MSERRLLGLALATLFLVHGPLLFGLGMDLPDDYIEYDVSAWEWWRHAIRNGLNPFFVPGKLGGVSLFGDVTAMGPFYPGIWLGVIVPVAIALPVACLLHAALLMFGTRALALEHGASAEAALLAGLACACGPLGVFGIVDGRAAAWPPVAWFPVVLLFVERARHPGKRGADAVLWGAAALAMAILGGHIRVAAVATVLAGVLALARRVPWRRLVTLFGLGILGGAPGVLPMLAEVRGSTSGGSRLAGLAALAEGDFDWSNLPGLVAPRATVFEMDYTVGFLLVAGLIVVAAARTLAVRGLLILAALGVLTAAATELPLGRVLFAPLLLLTHPVNDPWFALAVIPAAAAGAVGLDALHKGSRPRSLALLGLLLAGAVVMAVLGGQERGLAMPRARTLHWAGIAQAVGVAALLWLALRARRPIGWIVLLGMLDVGGLAVRVHTSAPSGRLDLAARGRVADVQELRDGYVDVVELAHFEGFAYGPGPGDPEEPGDEGDEFVEPWESVVASVREDFARRPLPPHLGMRIGAPALAGKAKLPPGQLTELLLPLAHELRSGPEAMGRLFAPGGAGRRLTALHGLPTIVGPDGRRTRLNEDELSPPCRLATSVVVEPDAARRRARLVGGARVDGQAMVARGVPVDVGPGTVRCTEHGAEVTSDGPTLLVLRQRLHPGWRFRGARFAPFAVDEVHTGVVLPSGTHTVRAHFVPPGLIPSALLMMMAWAVVARGLLVVRRGDAV